MEKGWFIDDLVPGTEFSGGLFQVRGVTPRPSGTNRPKITLELADRTGTRKAKSWDIDDALSAQLLSGAVTYVSVSGIVEAGGNYVGEVKMTGLEAAPVPEDVRPFLPELRPHHGNDKKRFFALVHGIGFPPLRELLRVLFQPHAKAFYEAYAAERRHHAYRGGLLRHTVEVAEMCQNACRIFPELRHDLLVCGALLHDFGKLLELDSLGNLTETGVLVGHIGEGMYRVRRAAESVPELPASIAQELTHLILSHHGQKEYGSPQTPATLEAQVLTHCDQLSASVTHHREVREQLHDTGARFSRKGADLVWAGDPRTADLDLSGKKVDLVQKMQEDPFSESSAPIPTTVRLPLLGWVAAGGGDQGSCLDHPENAEDWREVVPPPGGADFLLRVTGDSMVGVGIVEGDLLFVKRTQEMPRPGQIVIASVPDGPGGVVKRFDMDAAGTPWLASENSMYAPIPVTDGVRVQGRVVHLLRDYG
jgi:3'-5' exoribonuclease